jgi:hypothetical protein
MEENKTISRRKALGGLGIGLGVVVIPPVASAAPQHTAQNYLPEEMEDPTTKYPKPPFEPQSQPWPGLASKMNPLPNLISDRVNWQEGRH